MRAGLSTIQQTLTPEAATVLNQSIAEAGRRNHGQTTPLHVAATLLASPSGFLRQACIRSHPNSSHPLQCRALELCFSVALERLPTAQNTVAPASEPPISNALMAALKRAQAHQRRGCPEQQQQPLLAVKVELEQLIISILDDPSVSRVMREASFSSPAVKATIEQSLNNSNAQTHHPHQIPGGNVSFGSGFGGIGPRILSNSSQLTPAIPPPAAAAPLLPLVNRNMYLNPRLQTGTGVLMGNHKGDEVKKVLDIMGRSKKRNPILVGDSETEALVKELLRKIENKELGSDGILKNLQVLPLKKGQLSDKNKVAAKIEELGGLIESKIRAGGVILDLGELKWLVEQPASSGGAVQQPRPAAAISDAGRAAVVEITKLLARFGSEDGGHDSGNKLWLIGTATCETFLRCQVYHSTMETDWDLQAVPIASRSPAPGMFPRFGAERLLSSSTTVESLNPLKNFPVRMPLPVTKPASENMNPGQRSTFCPQCSENCDKELDKLAAIQKSFSEARQETTRPSLPQWLQSAKLDTENTDGAQVKDHELVAQQKKQELQKKWRDTCLHLHPNFHQNVKTVPPPSVSAMGLYSSNLLSHPSFHPKLHLNKPLGEALQLNMNQATIPPGSPVRTDLFLGSKVPNSSTNDETSDADQAKDFLGCISSEPQATKLLDKFAHASDADTYKKLLKGLMEKAWWQAEAATAVASAVTRFRLEDGKRHGAGSRGDIWLLFTGPDRVGKKKMASVVSDHICGASPIMICLGIRRDDEESDHSFRGKTAIDRIAEAVRRNPCSVIMLEDIDEADMLVRGSIKRAIERGRLIDSHGREVGLGNAIFIVTGDWSTTDPKALRDGHFVDQNKLASVASGSWQLGLIVRDKSAKRRASWLHLQDDERSSPLKHRREETSAGGGLSLDLNLAATSYGEDDKTDGSSDLTTIDHDDEPCLSSTGHFSITSVPHELVSNVDESIVFRPIESSFVRREIKKTISMRFSMVVDEKLPIEIGDDVLEKILGGLCHDQTSLREWVEKVVDPSFEQLKSQLPSGGDRSGAVVRLVVESDSCHRGKSKGNVDWLPSSILV